MDYNSYATVYYLFPIIGFVIALASQMYLNSNYNKYRYKNTIKRITGASVAREILDKNGLQDIKIVEIKGNLTDHYDPKKKQVSLSSEIFNGDTIASVSVAAHECGHAIQHKTGYTFLKIRTAIVPLVNFSTKIGYGVVMLGLIFGYSKLAIIGLILLLAMLFFQLITLPVEFNASNRAKKQLTSLNIIDNSESSDVNRMLTAAALTYVASLVTTLLQIIRLALIVLGRRRND